MMARYFIFLLCVKTLFSMGHPKPEDLNDPEKFQDRLYVMLLDIENLNYFFDFEYINPDFDIPYIDPYFDFEYINLDFNVLQNFITETEYDRSKLKIKRKKKIKEDKFLPKTKKRVSKWNKLTSDLFKTMIEYERKNPNVKQCELENIFNINRSTYWRWKKKYL